jgi:predicted acyltransferase (DUF342 family)
MALTRPRYSDIIDADYKQSCRTVTTTNITLSGGAPNTYDGLTLAAGDRILVNAQDTSSQNGIYTVTTVGTGSNGTWSRAFDANDNTKVTGGMQVSMSEGSFAGIPYRLTTPDPIVLGTTSLTFLSIVATVAGVNKGLQYNNSGFIAGASTLLYDSATGNLVISATTGTTTTSTGALIVKGGVGITENTHIGGNLNVTGNVIISGNLSTLGNVFITNTTDLSINDSIINLHTPTDLTPLLVNDGKDIGLKFHYYDVADSAAFLGRDNASGYLVWEDKGTDFGGIFTGTSYGTFKTGNIVLTGNTYRGTTSTMTHAIAYTTQNATPPTSPQTGDQWYDTSTDTLYEWFTDGTSSFWIDVLGKPTAINFASQSTAPIGPKTGDEWYDTSTDVLYTYIYDGVSYNWVDFSSKQPSSTAVATFFSSLKFDSAAGNMLVTPTTPTTSTVTGAVVVAGGIGLAGNLYVGGNIAIDGGQMTLYDSIIDLHTYGNLSPWTSDDGKDIGIRMHYFNGADKLAFMGLENSTKTLQFLVDATEVSSNVAGTFGNVQLGSLLLSNTTTSTSTTTGALVVAGGVGIAGDVYSGGNYNIGSNSRAVPTIYYSNSATAQYSALLVQRAGTELWLAGANPSENYVIRNNATLDAITVANVTGNVIVSSTTGSSSTTTGALVVKGGVGIAGNVNIGGSANLFIGGNQTTNGPAFSAYASNTLQTITSGSQQKVLFQVEEYDTNNNFSSSRFTPTVAGYYQLNAEVRLDGSSGTGEIMIVIWKNGAEYKRGTNQSGTSIATNFFAMTVSSLVYANGTTDYFEIYVQQGSGSSLTVTAVNAVNITWFNGCMIRGA